MNKLQLYYDYFEKYDYFDFEWYESLTKWTDLAQRIKSKTLQTNFNDLDDSQKKIEIEKIFAECSNKTISSIESFCQQYLYESSNGISTIRQQLLTHERRNEITNKLKSNPNILIEILTHDEIKEVEKLVRNLVIDNCNSVIYRFLRPFFPDVLSSPDAPNRLDQRIGIIQSKLGITISGNSNIEKHQNLMNSVTSIDKIKKQIFFWEIYNMLENNLNLKKAIVYYGAPGTGKTYTAKNVATQFIDQHRMKIGKNNDLNKYQIKTVQFHPSYSYEDFMEGIRPSSNGNLSLFNGTFKEFCRQVGQKEIDLYKKTDFLKNENFKEKDYNFSTIQVSELTEEQRNILKISSDFSKGITIEEAIEPAFFIIDEINRAELSRVFGELMYSLEYRGYNGKIKTQYAYLNKEEQAESVYFWENKEDWFFIPQNVYIIGTMNNIDRSVDSFDFALRRRFMWEEIQPNFGFVRAILTANWKDDLANAFEALNLQIGNEELLGKDYRIGHSYALAVKPIQHRFETAREVKEFLWNDFIKPLLEEYLRGLGDERKSIEKLNSFKKSFGLV